MTERLTIAPAAILDDAAERIRPEGPWTQDYSARDASGESCDPVSAKACAWCAAGAIFWAGYQALPDRLPFFDRAQATERLCVGLTHKLDALKLPTIGRMVRANDRLGFTQGQMCDLLTDTGKALRKQGATLTLTVA